ncbi:hypothetical protein LH51_14560 [Nitrincola sp. A-D6]|uniref:toxin VasX n=1 Tax=Nitrincola sp. A-D6 TaxID=1545442 RepID=UPI00051F8798|nr:toxin VasX [Nitrincola sp. A-D6]KGK41462.1 hypothetical protein LH51_14560 [Nitrincola sp. A-D6]
MAKMNDCIAYCDPRKIVPIIPCRYVVSDEILLTDLDDLPQALQAPAGIGNSPHHQIASIRQGYIYFYGYLGFNESDCTDKKMTWLIFRYQTRADDCNSNDEPTACASTFQYYNYTWKNGTARSEWIAHQMESEPFAYVNMAAMDTYIAYSEERWPAYMFEEIERNPSWRDKVMQPFTLHEEDGTDPHVMKLDNLQALVEDYKDSDPEEREANVLRHTAIGQLDITPFEQMKNSDNEHIRERYEYARIVAIQDTLGEAKDLLRLLEIEEANIQNYETEHHYAMVTAKAIASVDKLENTINKRYVDPGIQLWNNITYATRKVFSTDPFNRSADELRHKFATYGPEQRKKYKRLAEYWKTLDQRPGVHEPARLALQGAEQKRCEQCIGFAASQLGAYVDGVRLNAFTPAALYNKLKLNPDDIEGNDWDNSEWAILFAGMTKVASEIVNELSDPIVINRIQQTFFDVYIEVSTTLFEDNSQIQKTHLERLIGVTERKVRIPTSELNNQMHQYYERFLIGESSTLTVSSDGQSSHGRNSGLQQSTHRYGTIDIITYDHITDTPVGKVSTGLSGIAMVLALFSAQQTIKGWHDSHNFDARSKAGAIANLPAVQLSLAFSTVVGNYATLRAEPTYIRTAQQASRLATRFAAYAISGATGKNYILPQKANIGGISNAQLLERAKYAKLLGGLALVTGLLVSAGQGAEGINAKTMP